MPVFWGKKYHVMRYMFHELIAMARKSKICPEVFATEANSVNELSRDREKGVGLEVIMVTTFPQHSVGVTLSKLSKYIN